MATSVSVNLIHIFSAGFDPVWQAIITRHHHEHRFWFAVDVHKAFYAQPGLFIHFSHVQPNISCFK